MAKSAAQKRAQSNLKRAAKHCAGKSKKAFRACVVSQLKKK